MRTTTALARQNRAVMQLRDLYSMAESFGMDSASLHSAEMKIQGETLAKCPAWTRSHFDGYRRALMDSLYSRALIFGGFVDGRFYSTHRNRPDYYETNGITPADYSDDGRVLARGHYWAPKGDASPRPFFTSSVESAE